MSALPSSRKPAAAPSAAQEVEVLPPTRPGFGAMLGGLGAGVGKGGGAAGGLQQAAVSHLIAYLMDNLLKVPGFKKARIGINPLLDLIPGVGDGAATLIQALTIVEGARRRVPKVVLTRMFLNTLLNGFMGMIPGVGEVFAFWFKPTTRNYDLLLRHAPLAGSAAAQRTKATTGDWAFVVALVAVMALVMIGFITVGLYVIWWLGNHLFHHGA